MMLFYGFFALILFLFVPSFSEQKTRNSPEKPKRTKKSSIKILFFNDRDPISTKKRVGWKKIMIRSYDSRMIEGALTAHKNNDNDNNAKIRTTRTLKAVLFNHESVIEN